MSKIIIENKSSASDLECFYYIKRVIENGRVSGDSYCYATVFNDDIVVYANKNKMSDKFTVINHVKNN